MAYKSEQDVLAEFIDECCEVGADASEPSRELYAAYLVWSKGNHAQAMSKKAMGRRLDEKGFIVIRTSAARKRKGLCLSSRGRQLANCRFWPAA